MEISLHKGVAEISELIHYILLYIYISLEGLTFLVELT